GVVLLLIDGFLKPILIAKSGGKLPFLVLFLGVIGGLAAWGFTGMFKGAIILAVFYTLFTSWLEKKNTLS
ncbi:MAG: AI-2E family transporter YdiK, partial [Chitinophaga rupis]